MSSNNNQVNNNYNNPLLKGNPSQQDQPSQILQPLIPTASNRSANNARNFFLQRAQRTSTPSVTPLPTTNPTINSHHNDSSNQTQLMTDPPHLDLSKDKSNQANVNQPTHFTDFSSDTTSGVGSYQQSQLLSSSSSLPSLTTPMTTSQTTTTTTTTMAFVQPEHSISLEDIQQYHYQPTCQDSSKLPRGSTIIYIMLVQFFPYIAPYNMTNEMISTCRIHLKTTMNTYSKYSKRVKPRLIPTLIKSSTIPVQASKGTTSPSDDTCSNNTTTTNNNNNQSIIQHSLQQQPKCGDICKKDSKPIFQSIKYKTHFQFKKMNQSKSADNNTNICNDPSHIPKVMKRLSKQKKTTRLPDFFSYLIYHTFSSKLKHQVGLHPSSILPFYLPIDVIFTLGLITITYTYITPMLYHIYPPYQKQQIDEHQKQLDLLAQRNNTASSATTLIPTPSPSPSVSTLDQNYHIDNDGNNNNNNNNAVTPLNHLTNASVTSTTTAAAATTTTITLPTLLQSAGETTAKTTRSSRRKAKVRDTIPISIPYFPISIPKSQTSIPKLNTSLFVRPNRFFFPSQQFLRLLFNAHINLANAVLPPSWAFLGPNHANKQPNPDSLTTLLNQDTYNCFIFTSQQLQHALYSHTSTTNTDRDELFLKYLTGGNHNNTNNITSGSYTATNNNYNNNNNTKIHNLDTTLTNINTFTSLHNIPWIDKTSISFKQLYNLITINPQIPFILPGHFPSPINQHDKQIIAANLPSLYQTNFQFFETIQQHSYYSQHQHYRFVHWKSNRQLQHDLDEFRQTTNLDALHHHSQQKLSSSSSSLAHSTKISLDTIQSASNIRQYTYNDEKFLYDEYQEQLRHTPLRLPGHLLNLSLSPAPKLHLKSHNPWLHDILNPPVNIQNSLESLQHSYSTTRHHTAVYQQNLSQQYQTYNNNNHNNVRKAGNTADNNNNNSQQKLPQIFSPNHKNDKNNYSQYHEHLANSMFRYQSSTSSRIPLLTLGDGLPLSTLIIDEPVNTLSIPINPFQQQEIATIAPQFGVNRPSVVTNNNVNHRNSKDQTTANIVNPTFFLQPIELSRPDKMYEFANKLLFEQLDHALSQNQDGFFEPETPFEETCTEAEYFMIYGDDDSALELEMLLGFTTFDAKQIIQQPNPNNILNASLATTTTTTTTTTPPPAAAATATTTNVNNSENKQNANTSINNDKLQTSTRSSRIHNLLQQRFTSPHRDGITRREFFRQISDTTKQTASVLMHLLPQRLAQFLKLRVENLQLVTERIQTILNHLQHAKYHTLRLVYTLYSASIAIKHMKCIWLYSILFHITNYIYTLLISKYQHVILVLKWYIIILSLELEQLEQQLDQITENKKDPNLTNKALRALENSTLARYTRMRDPMTKLFYPPILLLAGTHTMEILAQGWNSNLDHFQQQVGQKHLQISSIAIKHSIFPSSLHDVPIAFTLNGRNVLSDLYQRQQNQQQQQQQGTHQLLQSFLSSAIVDSQKQLNKSATSIPSPAQSLLNHPQQQHSQRDMSSLEQLTLLLLLQAQIVKMIGDTMKVDSDNVDTGLNLPGHGINNSSQPIPAVPISQDEKSKNNNNTDADNPPTMSGTVETSPNVPSSPSTTVAPLDTAIKSWYLDNDGYLNKYKHFKSVTNQNQQKMQDTGSGDLVVIFDTFNDHNKNNTGTNGIDEKKFEQTAKISKAFKPTQQTRLHSQWFDRVQHATRLLQRHKTQILYQTHYITQSYTISKLSMSFSNLLSGDNQNIISKSGSNILSESLSSSRGNNSDSRNNIIKTKKFGLSLLPHQAYEQQHRQTNSLQPKMIFLDQLQQQQKQITETTKRRNQQQQQQQSNIFARILFPTTPTPTSQHLAGTTVLDYPSVFLPQLSSPLSSQAKRNNNNNNSTGNTINHMFTYDIFSLDEVINFLNYISIQDDSSISTRQYEHLRNNPTLVYQLIQRQLNTQHPSQRNQLIHLLSAHPLDQPYKNQSPTHQQQALYARFMGSGLGMIPAPILTLTGTDIKYDLYQNSNNNPDRSNEYPGQRTPTKSGNDTSIGKVQLVKQNQLILAQSGQTSLGFKKQRLLSILRNINKEQSQQRAIIRSELQHMIDLSAKHSTHSPYNQTQSHNLPQNQLLDAFTPFQSLLLSSTSNSLSLSSPTMNCSCMDLKTALSSFLDTYDYEQLEQWNLIRKYNDSSCWCSIYEASSSDDEDSLVYGNNVIENDESVANYMFLALANDDSALPFENDHSDEAISPEHKNEAIILMNKYRKLQAKNKKANIPPQRFPPWLLPSSLNLEPDMEQRMLVMRYATAMGFKGVNNQKSTMMTMNATTTHDDNTLTINRAKSNHNPSNAQTLVPTSTDRVPSNVPQTNVPQTNAPQTKVGLSRTQQLLQRKRQEHMNQIQPQNQQVHTGIISLPPPITHFTLPTLDDFDIDDEANFLPSSASKQQDLQIPQQQLSLPTASRSTPIQQLPTSRSTVLAGQSSLSSSSHNTTNVASTTIHDNFVDIDDILDQLDREHNEQSNINKPLVQLQNVPAPPLQEQSHIQFPNELHQSNQNKSITTTTTTHGSEKDHVNTNTHTIPMVEHHNNTGISTDAVTAINNTNNDDDIIDLNISDTRSNSSAIPLSLHLSENKFGGHGDEISCGDQQDNEDVDGKHLNVIDIVESDNDGDDGFSIVVSTPATTRKHLDDSDKDTTSPNHNINNNTHLNTLTINHNSKNSSTNIKTMFPTPPGFTDDSYLEHMLQLYVQYSNQTQHRCSHNQLQQPQQPNQPPSNHQPYYPNDMLFLCQCQYDRIYVTLQSSYSHLENLKTIQRNEWVQFYNDFAKEEETYKLYLSSQQKLLQQNQQLEYEMEQLLLLEQHNQVKYGAKMARIRQFALNNGQNGNNNGLIQHDLNITTSGSATVTIRNGENGDNNDDGDDDDYDDDDDVFVDCVPDVEDGNGNSIDNSDDDINIPDEDDDNVDPFAQYTQFKSINGITNNDINRINAPQSNTPLLKHDLTTLFTPISFYSHHERPYIPKRPNKLVVQTIPAVVRALSRTYQSNLIKKNKNITTSSSSRDDNKTTVAPSRYYFPLLLNSNITSLLIHLATMITIESYLPFDVYNDLQNIRTESFWTNITQNFLCQQHHQRYLSNNTRTYLQYSHHKYSLPGKSNQDENESGEKTSTAQSNIDQFGPKNDSTSSSSSYQSSTTNPHSSFPLFSTDMTTSTPDAILYNLFTLFDLHLRPVLHTLSDKTQRTFTTSSLVVAPPPIYRQYLDLLSTSGSISSSYQPNNVNKKSSVLLGGSSFKQLLAQHGGVDIKSTNSNALLAQKADNHQQQQQPKDRKHQFFTTPHNSAAFDQMSSLFHKLSESAMDSVQNTKNPTPSVTNVHELNIKTAADDNINTTTHPFSPSFSSLLSPIPTEDMTSLPAASLSNINNIVKNDNKPDESLSSTVYSHIVPFFNHNNKTSPISNSVTSTNSTLPFNQSITTNTNIGNTPKNYLPDMLKVLLSIAIQYVHVTLNQHVNPNAIPSKMATLTKSLYDNPFESLYNHFQVLSLPCTNTNYPVHPYSLNNMMNADDINLTNDTNNNNNLDNHHYIINPDTRSHIINDYVQQPSHPAHTIIDTTSTIPQSLLQFIMDLSSDDGAMFNAIIYQMKHSIEQQHMALQRQLFVYDHISGLYVTQEQLYAAKNPEDDEHLQQLKEFSPLYLPFGAKGGSILDFLDDDDNDDENDNDGGNYDVDAKDNHDDNGVNSEANDDSKSTTMNHIPSNANTTLGSFLQNVHHGEDDYHDDFDENTHNIEMYHGDDDNQMGFGASYNNDLLESILHESDSESSCSDDNNNNKTKTNTSLISTKDVNNTKQTPDTVRYHSDAINYAPLDDSNGHNNQTKRNDNHSNNYSATSAISDNANAVIKTALQVQMEHSRLFQQYYKLQYPILFNQVQYKRFKQPHLYRLLSHFHGILSPNFSINRHLIKQNGIMVMQQQNRIGSASLLHQKNINHDGTQQNEPPYLFLDLSGDPLSINPVFGAPLSESSTTLINYYQIFAQFNSFVQIMSAKYTLREDEIIQLQRHCIRILSYYIHHYQQQQFVAFTHQYQNDGCGLVQPQHHLLQYNWMAPVQQSVPWNESNELIRMIYYALIDVEKYNDIGDNNNNNNDGDDSDSVVLSVNKMIQQKLGTISHDSDNNNNNNSVRGSTSLDEFVNTSVNDDSDNVTLSKSTPPAVANVNNLLFFTYTPTTLLLTLTKLCPISRQQRYYIQQTWLRTLSLPQLQGSLLCSEKMLKTCFPSGYHQLFEASIQRMYGTTAATSKSTNCIKNNNTKDKDTSTITSPSASMTTLLLTGPISLVKIFSGCTNNATTIPVNPFQSVITLLNTLSAIPKLHSTSTPQYNVPLANYTTTTVSSVEEMLLVITMACRLINTVIQLHAHFNHIQQHEYEYSLSFANDNINAANKNSLNKFGQQKKNNHIGNDNIDTIVHKRASIKSQIGSTTKFVLNEFAECNNIDISSIIEENQDESLLLPLQQQSSKSSPALQTPLPIAPIQSLGADDFLPLLTWVLIHCDIGNICELMEMIQAYLQTVGVSNGEMEYYANNVLTAMQVILNEPFDKHHHYFK